MNIFKRSMVFVSFFGCCFSLALMAASLGTRHWFEATCRQRITPIPGSISQVRHIIQDRTNGSERQALGEEGDEVYRPNSTGFVNFGLFHGDKGLNVGFGERISDFAISPGDGLLNQGLWGTTIGCLVGALLFAVLGAVFAVINTATTPVEAISGIPGLYIWNAVAAGLQLIAVISWSVQFTTYLSKNILIVESKEGWTTKGHEKLGYSFWLVVVAIVVHLANLGLIAFGTYEPKVKEKIQEPDKATNDILLY